MAESSDINLTLIKMDNEEDDSEELIDFNLVEAAEEIFKPTLDDPLLKLVPIVYTTKLDDMQTVTQDLTVLHATEIINKLHSESKPVISYPTNKYFKIRDMDSRRPSFKRVSRVVSEISKRKKVTEKSMLHDTTQQNIRCKPCSVVLNDVRYMVKNQRTIKLPTSKILEKPRAEITLTDIKPENNNNSSENDFSLSGIKKEVDIDISVPKEQVQDFVNVEDPLKMEPTEFSFAEQSKTLKNVPHALKNIKTYGGNRSRAKKRPRIIFEDSDDEEEHIPLKALKKSTLSLLQPSAPEPTTPSVNTPTFIVAGTKIDLEASAPKPSAPTPSVPTPIVGQTKTDRRAVTPKPSAPTPSVPTPIVGQTKTDRRAGTPKPSAPTASVPTPIVGQIKTYRRNGTPKPSAPTPSVPKPIVGQTKTDRKAGNLTHAPSIVTDMVFTPQDKYYLIVLTNKNNESTIYRTNATKFVTDYYMITNPETEYMINNELVLASLFPKEEKIVEKYCCWYRREDIISKLCVRKNFPFVIQKFLKQPHGCSIERCMCCCREALDTHNNSTPSQVWREIIENNLKKTDTRVRDVLEINTNNSDLISKTLKYIPKIRELGIYDRLANTRESKLNDILLCIENNNQSKYNLPEFELYCIGNNGDVQQTLFSNDREEVQLYQKSYQPMSDSKGDIKNAVICCWYKREKLMLDLKMLKASPAALRHIQKPHSCERKNCSCCCKPRPVKLMGDNIMPPNLHHTVPYEKTDKIVEIYFNNYESERARNKDGVRLQLPSQKPKTMTGTANPVAVILSDCAVQNDKPSPSIDITVKNKTVKLGVTKFGEIEVVLDEPANTLPVEDLVVLSNCLGLATDKMSQLELTAEEFCSRVNSTSTEPIQINDLVATVLRMETATPEPIHINGLVATVLRMETATPGSVNQDYHSDELKNNDNMADTGVIETKEIRISKPTAPLPTPTEKARSTSLAKRVTHVSIPILQKPTTSKAGLFSALSGLTLTKSKCYMDSLKSFFKPKESSNKVTLQRTQEESLPVISKTFSLKSTSESVIPAERVSPGVHQGKASINNTKINGLANSVKLRVKPVSELIARDNISNVKWPSSEWPASIVNNVETPIAAQTIPSNMTVSTRPAHPTFMIPQNVPVGTTFQVVRQPSCENATTSSLGANGAHLLTLMPIRGPIINPNSIRRPDPNETLPNAILPQLVPISHPSAPIIAPELRQVYQKR